ncbi:MAG: hypothetical protein FWH40_01175 [Coriobacteriia bacterium]|nr:hypothetical protein [Coriobacteriia bacterium]
MRQLLRTILSVALTLFPATLPCLALCYGMLQGQAALLVAGVSGFAVIVLFLMLVQMTDMPSVKNVLISTGKSVVLIIVAVVVTACIVILNSLINRDALNRGAWFYLLWAAAMSLVLECLHTLYLGYLKILRWVYNHDLLARIFDNEVRLNRIIERTDDQRVLYNIALQESNPPLSRILAADRILNDRNTVRGIYESIVATYSSADISADMYEEPFDSFVLADVRERTTSEEIQGLAKERLAFLGSMVIYDFTITD